MENKDLTTVITNKRGKVNVIDSREVAEMLGKEHSYVLEMIQGRKGKLGIIPVLTNANLAVVNYFIESIYIFYRTFLECYSNIHTFFNISFSNVFSLDI